MSGGGAGERVPLRVACWNLNHWRQLLLPPDTRRDWPRFGLAVLEGPASLMTLVGVLDRIATDSSRAAHVSAPDAPVAEVTHA